VPFLFVEELKRDYDDVVTKNPRLNEEIRNDLPTPKRIRILEEPDDPV
jgi:hypothetical protein